MRRLPIYFLIDVSESMVGDPIQLVEEGLATIIRELKSDPYALETVYVSIIAFAGQAKTIVPLQDIISFYPPKFPVGSGTSFGSGLGHLMHELRRNIIKTTTEVKGDWKPIVFLFTDGVPTDDTKAVIAEWKNNWQRQANLVAISFGTETDLQLLRQITENVLLFDNTTPQSYKAFFKWVTASIKTSSLSVDANGSGFELARLDDDIIAKVDNNVALPPPQVDSNFAVFAAKCQTNKRPYLIKYKRTEMPSNVGGLGFNTLAYRLVGTYPVDNSYFELTGEAQVVNKVSTEELIGFPNCPCCGNQYGFSVCSCGKVHCTGGEEVTTCPWCGNQGRYGFGEGHIDINRTQG
jgi:uncharacterized protein YegL